MAEYSFDFQRMYENAFGIRPSTYLAPGNYDVTNLATSVPFRDVQVLDVPGSDAKSLLGTPVYTPLVFKDGTDVNDEEFDGIDLSQIAPIVDVDRAKNIVKTHPPDLASSVKEEISQDDYRIRIRGILVNMEGESKPYDQIAQLDALCNVEGAIEVESELLNKLGIDQLVIQRRQFRNQNNLVNAQAFTLDCIHDTPADLIIDDDA